MYLGSAVILGACVYLYNKYKIGKIDNSFKVFPVGDPDVDRLILSYVSDNTSLFNIFTTNKYINDLQNKLFWKICLMNRYKLKCYDNTINYKQIYPIFQNNNISNIIHKSRKIELYDKVYGLLADNKKCIYFKYQCNNDVLHERLKFIVRSMKSKLFGGNYNNRPWIIFFNNINESLEHDKIVSKVYSNYTNIFHIIIAIQFNNITYKVDMYHNKPMKACEVLFNISKILTIKEIDIIGLNSKYSEFFIKAVNCMH